MARPTNEAAAEKRLERVFGALRKRIDNDDAVRLTVREIKFAFLIASEGYNQHDSYVESFEPSETALKDSIDQMASRVANRPRVKNEMERIRKQQHEENLRKEENLVALNGEAVRQRIAIDLYVIATNGDLPLNYRMPAYKMLGDLKHVSAFEKASTNIDASRTNNMLVVDPNATPGEARAQLMNHLQKIMAPRPAASQTVDLKTDE